MKKIISLVCALVLLALCVAPMPAKAAANDTLKLSSVFLRSAEGKEGIFFGAYFNLSQDTLDDMSRYGLAMTVNALEDDAAWTAAMDNGVQRSWYTTGLTAGVRKEVTSTALVNIINISNDTMTNNRNATTVIYVRPYVEMQDGSFVYGDAAPITMKQVAQMVDAAYSTLTDNQKRGLLGMYERFNTCMKGWGLTNVKANYPNGTDVNGESLILQYRRNKVAANMQAQAEILWSIVGSDPVKYSRAPSSNGYDADTQSNVYTLYPGRIYKGIPYTHGSAGLDAYYTYGTQTSDGVWELEGVNSSTFNGGASTSTFNVSRIGNDCWDAISWAYESIGSSVSSDQTNQVTPDYGMYPLGNFDMEHFLAEAASNGKRHLTYMDDAYATYYKDNAANRQLVYEAYALLQKGDTLVHYIHDAGGHALMAFSVDIVRNSDNTINPDESTVTYIEQGSSNEKAQSVDFDVDNLSSDWWHTYNHDVSGQQVSDPANCVDCATEAGYDKETGIWTMNPGKVTSTLTELFDEGYYIPMTSEELRNPAAKINASRLSDSVSDNSNVNNLYAGKLSSTYRVSKVVLDIYDAAGQKINSATCLSAQADLNNALNLARFITDQTVGKYGSVLKGTPALNQMSYTYNVLDEEGNQVYNYKAATGIIYNEETGIYILSDGTALPADTYYYLADAEAGTYAVTDGTGLAADTALYTRTAKTATAKWLEAPTLEAGSYSFTMTCVLANGYTNTFRTGYFTVAEGEHPTTGETVSNMVYAD